MKKVRMLLVLGVWVTILPYLGFPYSWKDVLYTLTGLVLVFLSYLLYKGYKKEDTLFDNFTENNQDGVVAEIEITEKES